MRPFGHKCGYLLVAGMVLVGATALIGCGGGNGGDNGPAVIAGVVTSTTGGRTIATAVPGAAVKAYVWPDITTAVVTTTTDTNGKYSVTVPPTAVAKDVVIVAEKSAGTPPVTTRFATIVAELPGRGTSAAHLDPSTTVATEVVVKKAKDLSAPDIAGPCFATVLGEIRTNLTHIDQASMVPGGPELPMEFGCGLKGECGCDKFIKGSATITAALATVAESSSSDVRQAKRIAQTLRDMANSINLSVKADTPSLQDMMLEQKGAVQASTQLATALAARTQLAGTMLTHGASATKDEGLIGRAPGAYDQTVSGGHKTLSKTGNAADGKSWIVTSKVAGSTLNKVLTITPATPVTVFALDSTMPQLTLGITQSSDPKLSYTGTVKVTADTDNNPTEVTVNISMADKDLPKPIVIQGTLRGEPAAGSTLTAPAYTQIGFSGSVTSPFGNATIGNLSAQWFSSSAAGDLQQVTLSQLNLTTAGEKPATITIAGGTLSYDAADPSHGFPDSTIRQLSLVNATLKGANHDLTIGSGNITFDRFKPATGPIVYLMDHLSGNLTYTSPTLKFTGNVLGNWTNTALTYTNVADFPKASVHFVGTLTPASGNVTSADLTLTSSNAVTAGNTVEATLAITKLAYGSETLTGSIKAAFAVANKVVQTNPAVTATLVHSPSNYKVTLTGKADNLSGTITDSAGSKKADIGKAGDLHVGGASDALVIRYSDNSFETVASILP